MADSKISALPPAATLTGAELVPVVQAGNSVRSTVSAVAALVNAAYTPPGIGAVTRTVSAKLNESVSVLDFGADPTGVADSTSAIQNAINANYGGSVFFPAGKFKIISAINVLQKINITGVAGLTTIVLATQNQNGFVIGDGTSPTRTACFNTSIYNINFNPASGITAFTSGICIYLNYVAFVDVVNCTLFGSDGVANKLFEGIRAFQASEFNVRFCRFTNLLGIGANLFGSATNALRTVDGRIDFCEFTSITGDAIYLGLNAVGITINCPVMYSNLGTNIHVDVTTNPSQGANIFILQPDIEVDSASLTAINVTNGQAVFVDSGWVGAGGGTVGGIALSVAAAANGVRWNAVRVDQLSITLSGPACELIGGEVTGDGSTTPTGITVNSTATDTQIIGMRIRQWITNGISFVGQPPRCLVDGCIFKSNGNEVTGYSSYGTVALGPKIRSCQSDASGTILPAASITLRIGQDLIQLSGAATTITTMTPFSIGQRITFQAGDAAGDTFAGGGNIQLKTTPTTVPQFKIMSFVSDGANWFEDGRNF